MILDELRWCNVLWDRCRFVVWLAGGGVCGGRNDGCVLRC